MAELTDKVLAEIRRLADEGKTVKNISKNMKVPYSTVYNNTRKGPKGKYLSHSEYKENLIRVHSSCSSEYRKKRAIANGYKNPSHYNDALSKERTNNQMNIDLSEIIITQLKKLGKTQVWLAEKIGVCKQTITLYKQRKNIPEPDKLQLLYDALQIEKGIYEFNMDPSYVNALIKLKSKL